MWRGYVKPNPGKIIRFAGGIAQVPVLPFGYANNWPKRRFRSFTTGRMCVAALRQRPCPTMILRMAPADHIQFTVRLPVRYSHEGGAVIAHSPGIDVASHGPSKQAAHAALVEAMQLWFISCFERGQLDAALKECGFASIPAAVDASVDMIDVPVPFATLQNVPEARTY